MKDLQCIRIYFGNYSPRSSRGLPQAKSRGITAIAGMGFLFLLLLITTSPLNSLIIGADSSPSRQAAVLFAGTSNNAMNGFSAFENGFVLRSQGTTCTYDSFFPISGSVKMNGETICLGQDLLFDNATNMVNFGNIYGNGYSVEFADSITTLTLYKEISSISWGQIARETRIGYAMVSCDWSWDNQYFVFASNNSSARRLYIDSFNGSSLSSISGDAVLQNNVNSVRAHPYQNVFAVGCTSRRIGWNYYEMNIYKLVGSTLTLAASENPDVNINAVAWRSDGNYVAAGGANLRVYSFNNTSTTIGTAITRSLLSGETISQNALCWDQTGNYIAAGITHSTASKLGIYYFNGSAITLSQSFSTTVNAVWGVDWSRTGSFIAVGTAGTTTGVNQLRVYLYNSSTNVITEVAKVTTGGTTAGVYGVHWNSDATRILVGLQSGASNEVRVYNFNSTTSGLTLESQLEKSTNITDVRWSRGDEYFGCAEAANAVSVFFYNPNFISSTSSGTADSIILDNVNLIFNNNMTWMMASTIQKNCLFEGNGNRITFSGVGQISVTAGAQLTLQNVQLAGLANQNLRCANNNASIVFRDCIVCLDNNYDFTTGSILFEGDVAFVGTNQFCYASRMGSTLAANSVLFFDHDVAFKYDPPVANRDLLYMADETSCFYLNGATLISTATGMRLTRGTIFLDNGVTFSCAGIFDSESICFGNNVTSNDVTIKILSDATVTVYGGLCYQNVG